MLSELDEAIEIVNKFKSLSPEFLNQKLEDNTWSIAECLDHVIVTNTSYFKQFNKILKGRKEDTFWEGVSPFTEMLSKWLLKRAGRDVSKKMKSPPAFKPTSLSSIPSNIVEQFIIHQEELRSYYTKFQAVKIEQFIISSPASGFITLYLDYVLLLLTSHQLRHLDQALHLKVTLESLKK